MSHEDELRKKQSDLFARSAQAETEGDMDKARILFDAAMALGVPYRVRWDIR